MLRNKLAENAKRILATKSFDDGIRQVERSKNDTMSQSKLLAQSGFDATKALNKPADEPASYSQYETTGAANFAYQRNPKVEKVTETDPPLKNLGKMRYNIITGSLQQWY